MTWILYVFIKLSPIAFVSKYTEFQTKEECQIQMKIEEKKLKKQYSKYGIDCLEGNQKE